MRMRPVLLLLAAAALFIPVWGGATVAAIADESASLTTSRTGTPMFEEASLGESSVRKPSQRQPDGAGPVLGVPATAAVLLRLVPLMFLAGLSLRGESPEPRRAGAPSRAPPRLATT